MKYRYTGSGVMTFSIGEKSYTVGKNDYRLKDTVDLPKKVDIPGLVLVEESNKSKKNQ